MESSSTATIALPQSQLGRPPDISLTFQEEGYKRGSSNSGTKGLQNPLRKSFQISPNLDSLSDFPLLGSQSQGITGNIKDGFSKSWNDVIKENNFHNKGAQLQYYEPLVKDNIRYALIDEKLILKARDKWQNSIAFYVYGNKPYYNFLREYIDRTWKIKGSYQLFTRENGFFIIKLENNEDCENILAGGPYFYNKKLILMKRWCPGMQLSKEFLHTIPIWIQLPNLELDFWSTEAISRIASVLGKPVKLDQITEEIIRISYARVLIEIDTNFAFPAEIPIQCYDGTVIMQKIKYEWHPSVCSNCKIFGHSNNSCSAKKVWIQKDNPNRNIQMDVDVPIHTSDKDKQNILNSNGSDIINTNMDVQLESLPDAANGESSTIQSEANIILKRGKIGRSSQQTTPINNVSTANQFNILSNLEMNIMNDSENVINKSSYPTSDGQVSEMSNPMVINNRSSEGEQNHSSHTASEQNLKKEDVLANSGDINMQESNFLSSSFKNKRSKINLNNLNGESVMVDGEPFVESNPKWNNLVSQIKSKSKAKKSKEDGSLSGGVLSRGISKNK